MSTNATTSSGGAAQTSSGTSETNVNQVVDSTVTIDAAPNTPQTVAYESYAKLLKEKKALQERQAALDAETKNAHEQKLKEKENFKALLELREKEASEYKSKYESLNTRLASGLKLDAFLKALPGEVDPKFYQLIDIDKILVNDETGMPDKASVLEAAKQFVTDYGTVLVKKSGATMPNQAASGGTTKLSYDEWLALPKKDMAKRMKDVVST
jgi:predicted DNA binding CopG/RHH family protein